MMKSPDPFYTFYKAELLPFLRPIERKRKRKLLSIVLLILLSLIVIIIVSWFFSSVISTATKDFEQETRREFYTRTLSFIFMGSILFSYFIHYFIKKFALLDYSAQFKYFILSKLAGHVDNRLTYFQNKGISEYFLEMSKLFKTQGHSLYSEDKVQGFIGKTKVEISEFFFKQDEFESETRSENYLFIMADFNKDFFEHVVVAPRNILPALKGHPALSPVLYKFQFDEIKMDSPEFNNKFFVHANDSIVAHYILTPNLMDRIVKFSQRVKEPVFFSFYASSLYIVIPYQKRLFEPRLLSSMISFRTICEYHEILKLSLAIVNDLNLNTRIWTKE